MTEYEKIYLKNVFLISVTIAILEYIFVFNFDYLYHPWGKIASYFMSIIVLSVFPFVSILGLSFLSPPILRALSSK